MGSKRGIIMCRGLPIKSALIVLILPLVACQQIVVDGGDVASCAAPFSKGVLSLGFNPTQIKTGDVAGRKSLFIPSYFNVEKDPVSKVFTGTYRDRDKVGLIADIRNVDFDAFDPINDIEILTDLNLGRTSTRFGRTVWPNGATVVAEDVVPFTAVMLPQGFLNAKQPGRLSIINLDDENKTEYLIHQSKQNGGFTKPLDPDNSPRWYHEVRYYDVDKDGYKDVVAVRSGFRPGREFHPPHGELVWFENPGETLSPNVPWRETILYGGPAVQFKGPDVHMDMADLDGDGSPEFITTHFFAEKISVMGAPEGLTWADVNALEGILPRSAIISDDQGRPFDVEVGDVNNDGRFDILASNHQPDNCSKKTASDVPGRVYVLELPKDNNIYQKWPVHVIKDNIRPQPSTEPISPPGRLAPGPAYQFNVVKMMKGLIKPRILVGGDEAGKAWVLRAKKPFDPTNWEYHSEVIFDINDHFGEGTTQRFLKDPPAITISTVGSPTIAYSSDGPFGIAEIYLPIFEAKQVHILSYKSYSDKPRIQCGTEALYACPAQK